MRKIFLVLVLLFFFQSNLSAKKPILWPAAVNFTVDEWIVEVKSYYNQSAGSKFAKSSNSLSEAETNALNACKEDKIFNLNKPEGCLLSKKTETYERTWRYDMGLMPPKPVEREVWDIYVRGFLANIESEKERIEDQKRITKLKAENRTILEKKYAEKCVKFSKSTENFSNCIDEQDKIVKETELKKLLAKQEQERKQLEAEQAKRKTIEDKQKEEANKLAKMSPDDRRAFTCSDKFGFRKGSDKFKDCVFKIYQAELELEKLELQRELAKANAETARVRAEAAKASEERQQNLARAQTEAATMQALAARQQAIAANTASSLQMIESGLRMMSPQQPAPRLQTNCYYHARSFSCF